MNPISPLLPSKPVSPLLPSKPVIPCEPALPVNPISPLLPVNPVAPCKPDPADTLTKPAVAVGNVKVSWVALTKSMDGYPYVPAKLSPALLTTSTLRNRCPRL